MRETKLLHLELCIGISCIFGYNWNEIFHQAGGAITIKFLKRELSKR